MATTMKRKSLLLAGAAAVVATAIALTTTMRPSSLAPPLEVVDVMALADGGTFFLKLQDRAGRHLGLQRIGDLRGASERQELRKIVYLGDWVPLPLGIEQQSEEWRHIQSLLDGVVAGNVSGSQVALLREKGYQGLSASLSPQVMAAFGLAEWMRLSESGTTRTSP